MEWCVFMILIVNRNFCRETKKRGQLYIIPMHLKVLKRIFQMLVEEIEEDSLNSSYSSSPGYDSLSNWEIIFIE